jgi:hypothetical protein
MKQPTATAPNHTLKASNLSERLRGTIKHFTQHPIEPVGTKCNTNFVMNNLPIPEPGLGRQIDWRNSAAESKKCQAVKTSKVSSSSSRVHYQSTSRSTKTRISRHTEKMDELLATCGSRSTSSSQAKKRSLDACHESDRYKKGQAEIEMLYNSTQVSFDVARAGRNMPSSFHNGMSIQGIDISTVEHWSSKLNEDLPSHFIAPSRTTESISTLFSSDSDRMDQMLELFDSCRAHYALPRSINDTGLKTKPISDSEGDDGTSSLSEEDFPTFDKQSYESGFDDRLVSTLDIVEAMDRAQ